MNKYTNLSTASFNPLSLEEIMMVPIGKQKIHDVQQDELARYSLFDINRLPIDDAEATKNISDYRTKVQGLENELMQTGTNRGIVKKLLDLKQERERALANDGWAGRMQQYYNQHIENSKNIRSNKDISPDWQQKYINYDLNNYKGWKEGYTPYFGAKTVSLTDKANEFAKSIPAQTLKNIVVNSPEKWGQWGIKNVDGIDAWLQNNYKTVKKDAEKMAPLIYNHLLNDPDSRAFIESQADIQGLIGKERNKFIESQLLYAAQNAATSYQINDAEFDQELKNTPAEKGKNKTEDWINFIQNEKGIDMKQFAEQGSILWGLINTESPIQAWSKVKEQYSKVLNDPNTSDTEKARIRKELYQANNAFEMASNYAMNESGIDINAIVNRAKKPFYAPGDKGKDNTLSKQDIMDAVEEGYFTSIFSDEKHLDSSISQPRWTDQYGDEHVVQKIPYSDKYILQENNGDRRSLTKEESKNVKTYIQVFDEKKGQYLGAFQKEDIENIKKYNESMNNALKKESLLPVKNLIIQSGKDAEEVMKYMNKDIGRALKSNLSSINQLIPSNKAGEELKAILKDFNQTGDFEDVKFLGFNTKEGSITMQVQVPSKNEKGTRIDRAIEIPMGEITADGSLPTFAKSIINRLRNSVDDNGQDMLDKFESTIRYNLIVPDGNFDQNNKVDYAPDQTNLIKKQLNEMNSYGNKLAEEISNAEDIRIFHPTKQMIPNIDNIPAYAKGISYKQVDGTEKILTLGQFFNNYVNEFPELSPQDISKLITTLYLQGELINPTENEIPAFFDDQGNILDGTKEIPLLSKDISNLIEF